MADTEQDKLDRLVAEQRHLQIVALLEGLTVLFEKLITLKEKKETDAKN